MTEKPIMTPVESREAIYENHLVKVVDTPNAVGRVKIQWDDSRNGLKELYVHETELTYMDEKLPAEIVALVQRVHPGFEASGRILAQQYVTLLRKIHAFNREGEWFRVYSEYNAPQAGRLRSECAVLLRGGFLDEQRAPGASDYRLSKLACAALGVEYISPVEKSEPAIVAQAEAVVERASDRQPVEIKTLVQRSMMLSPERSNADRELSDHLNSGWRLMDMQVLVVGDRDLMRVVTLQRWQEAPTAPQPQARANAAVIEESAPLATPVGPTVIITPEQQPVPMVLNLGPYGRSIRDNGLDETLAIADQAAAEKGRAAFAQALESAAIPVRPLIPAAAGEVNSND